MLQTILEFIIKCHIARKSQHNMFKMKVIIAIQKSSAHLTTYPFNYRQSTFQSRNMSLNMPKNGLFSLKNHKNCPVLLRPLKRHFRVTLVSIIIAVTVATEDICCKLCLKF